MGLHTGEPGVGAEGYHGLDVVRAARICSAGHGGQILISETTRALIGNELPPGVRVVDLGPQKLKDVQEERIFQLSLEGEADRRPAPRSRFRTRGGRSSSRAPTARTRAWSLPRARAARPSAGPRGRRTAGRS